MVPSSGINATTVVAISTVAAPPAKGRPYVVGMKRREVGLRLALGAARLSVLRHFVTQAMRVVDVECLTGLVLAAGFTRLLSGMLFGVSSSDPVTVVGVVAIVLFVTAVAALIPAARAALSPPMSAQRAE